MRYWVFCALLVFLLKAVFAAESERRVPSDGKAFRIQFAEGQTKLALSPDGTQLATAAEDGKLRLYSASDGKLLRTIEAHAQAVADVEFTPGGRLISAGGTEIKEWDPADGKELRQFKGHEGEVRSLATSRDGRYLASGDAAATIRVWELKRGQQVHALSGHKLDETQPEEEEPRRVDGLVFSPNSRLIVSEANDETARVWDALAGKQWLVAPQHDNNEAVLACSPNGAWVASARGGNFCPYGSALRLWEIYSGKTTRVFTGLSADAACAAFTPDGQYLFSAEGAIVRKWHVGSGIELRRWSLSNPVLALEVCRDGQDLYCLTPLTLESSRLWLDPQSPFNAQLDADDAWQRLGSPDYDARAAAIRHYRLMKDAEAVAELARRRRSTVHNPAAPELIALLDNERYGVRVQAFNDLREMGAAARQALIAACRSDSPEVRVRASELLKELGGACDLAHVLSIELLGAIHTREARTELGHIADEQVEPYAAHARALLARTD